MRATECRLKVIQRFLIRQVENREPERHLCMFSAKQIVCSSAEVEQVTRRDARRVRVVILGTISRDANA